MATGSLRSRGLGVPLQSPQSGSLTLSDSISELSSSVSDSGSIVSKSSTSALFSALQQILSSRLSDSASVLSFSTSGSGLGTPESPVKLESLVDLLSRLGSNYSLESLF